VTFALRSTDSESAWRDWADENLAVDDGCVRIAPAPEPAYGSPDRLPVDLEPVDLAVDDCGDLFLLAPDGTIHRYDPVRDAVERLSCTWRQAEAGDATAIAVTSRSLYVAGADGYLQAYARQLHQTRWIRTDPFESPVSLASAGDVVLVLDRGTGDDGFLATVRDGGVVDRVVEDLAAPRDVATADGTTHVLAGEDARVVASYDEAFDPIESVDVPDGFDATCLAAEPDGDPIVGVGPDTAGERTPFRLRGGTFGRLDGASGTASALVHAPARGRGRPAGLYAVLGEPVVEGPARPHRLASRTVRRRNPVTDRYDARAVTRFDSGEPGTQWHRVTAGISLAESGTQVRLRYLATDDGDLQYSDESVGLEVVDGIGPTYAARLRDAGVRGLPDLVEETPEAVASTVSTEVLDVSPSRVEAWMEAGRSLLEEREGTVDVEAIDGIGPTFGGRLRDAGIEDVETLVERTPAAISRVVSTEIYDVSPSRAASWIEDARDTLVARDDARAADWTTMDRPNPRDALLRDAEGRYLWVELELVGDRFRTPSVDRVRAYFPRQSYLRHLPAVYREDPASAAFLERFLSIFESVFTDVEEAVESVARYFDSAGVPAEALSWLSDWLAVEAGEPWPEPARRELLRRAPSLYKRRGTRRGLLEVLHIYLQHASAPRDGPDQRDVFVVEYSDLDCIDDPAVRDLYERLVPCPQCFLVLVRSWFDDEAVRAVERVVDREQPAHAVGTTVQLRPWIQLGGNAYLGVNSRLPSREFTVEESGLGTDSMLATRETSGQVGRSARIGTDTTLS